MGDLILVFSLQKDKPSLSSFMLPCLVVVHYQGLENMKTKLVKEQKSSNKTYGIVLTPKVGVPYARELR